MLILLLPGSETKRSDGIQKVASNLPKIVQEIAYGLAVIATRVLCTSKLLMCLETFEVGNLCPEKIIVSSFLAQEGILLKIDSVLLKAEP